MAFLVGARQRRTRKDILISCLSSPMSLRFYFMSLRGHPKEAAAISPSPFVPTGTRRLLRRCTPRNDTVKRVSLRVHPSFRKEAKQSHRPSYSFSLCHCPPEADGFPLPDWVGDRSGGNGISGGRFFHAIVRTFPMSLRFYFMSLRGHPKEAAAISPSPVVPTITRRLLRRPSAEGLLAMTYT